MALAFFPFNIIAIINYIFRLYSPYILGCYTTDGLKGITKVNSCAIITFFILLIVVCHHSISLTIQFVRH